MKAIFALVATAAAADCKYTVVTFTGEDSESECCSAMKTVLTAGACSGMQVTDNLAKAACGMVTECPAAACEEWKSDDGATTFAHMPTAAERAAAEPKVCLPACFEKLEAGLTGAGKAESAANIKASCEAAAATDAPSSNAAGISVLAAALLVALK